MELFLTKGLELGLWSHMGLIEELMMENIIEAFDSVYVECLAFLKAVEFAKDFRISHFILEGDALGVMQQNL